MQTANKDSFDNKDASESSVIRDGVFYKSSYSNSGGCVEVAKFADGSIKVRDTKDETKTTLTFTSYEWAMFLKGVRNSEFEME